MVGIIGLLDEREGVFADAPLQTDEMSKDPRLVLESRGEKRSSPSRAAGRSAGNKHAPGVRDPGRTAWPHLPGSYKSPGDC